MPRTAYRQRSDPNQLNQAPGNLYLEKFGALTTVVKGQAQPLAIWQIMTSGVNLPSCSLVHRERKLELFVRNSPGSLSLAKWGNGHTGMLGYK